MKSILSSFLAALALFTLSSAVVAQSSREEARILVATQVVEDLKKMPDQNVPDWLLDRAYGIAVIPSVVKASFVIGGRRGKGVLVVRDERGRWSSPVFIALTGGSIGWQAGVQSADIVLVFTTKAGVEGITDGKLTLGADAAVAAGPVGRQTSAATDANLSAEVYSYSRAKGLFAGIAVDGSVITIDKNGNAAYYGKAGLTASDILSNRAPQPPSSAQRFLNTLGQTAGGSQARRPAGNTSTAAPEAPEDTTPQASGLKTYPMEDPNPGQEPPQ